VLGTKVVILRPEAKGITERAHDYLERSFLPRRSFASPADFTTQLGERVAVANRRRRRALGCGPADRIGATGRPCWACLRFLRRSGGDRRCGCRGISTCC
jgi:hypothetical protein